MLVRLWLKLLALIAILLIPLVFIQMKQQEEALSLFYEVTNSEVQDEVLAGYLDDLRTLSKLDTENAETYEAKFRKVVELRAVQQDLRTIQSAILHEIQSSSQFNLLITILASLCVSALVARSIVRRFQVIAAENKLIWQKEQDLKSMRRWQNLAKTLVHEIRGPLTPIKLLSSTLAERTVEIEDADQREFFNESTGVILSQVQTVEGMLLGFSQFAKLPEPQLEAVSADDLISRFLNLHAGDFSDRIDFQFEYSEESKALLLADRQLIFNIFYNMVKNAYEANPSRIVVRFGVKVWEEFAAIDISGNGVTIPEEIASEMFTFRFSGNKSPDSANLGIGLTISKQVALDHGGNLSLLTNDSDRGVTFRLELRRKK